MYGTLYLIPCPISDETAVSDVLPALNQQIIDTLDYFIVENTRSARRFLSKAKISRPIDTLTFRVDSVTFNLLLYHALYTFEKA